MSFAIGIVGLPNVGKSTLFKALTKKAVDISNYPFCTINPNVGVVAVPDGRLEKLKEILKPEKVLPTTIEFVDIAGLVKNAHQGEGLGNQFLSHIREVDAILHLVRSFSDPNVAHVSGKIEPKEDAETVNLELVFADLDVLKKRLADLIPKAKSGDKEAGKKIEVFEKVKKHLEEGKLANTLTLDKEEKEELKELNLLTLKPILEIKNTDEKEMDTKKLSFSAKLELDLSELSEEEKKELGYQKTGLDDLIKACYQILDLITFFTTQNKILQAWTLKRDSNILEAAAKIHTEFAEGFIKAEVINWEELFKAGSEHEAREQGHLKTAGKDYVVQDGDVIHFHFK